MECVGAAAWFGKVPHWRVSRHPTLSSLPSVQMHSWCMHEWRRNWLDSQPQGGGDNNAIFKGREPGRRSPRTATHR